MNRNKTEAVVVKLKEAFKKSSFLTIDEIIKIFKADDPKLNLIAIRTRIHRLKGQGVLQIVRRGVYKFGHQNYFSPVISVKIKKIHSILKKQFPYLDFCTWETLWLHGFMQHIPDRSIIIIETENDAVEAVFNHLHSKNLNVFCKPTPKEVHQYISGSYDCIVVKSLVSQSPVVKYNKVIVPTIEKILVDIFVDKTLHGSYQGQEQQNIFENVLESFNVNIGRMYRYATRRGHEKELKKYLKENLSERIKYDF